MQTKNLKKNFVWNLIGSFLNSFSSLLFLIIVTRINGVNDAGIFSFAFAVACMLFYIGIYNGRVFQVTENTKISDKSFFATKVITVSLMVIVSLLYLAISQYDPFKTLVILGLCAYRAIEAFAEVIYGYFQKYNDLYLSGISMSLKAAIGTGAFLLVDYFTNNMLYAIGALIVVYLLVLIFFDFLKMRKYHIWKGKVIRKDILSILKNGFFPFALSFLALVVLNSSKYAIDAFSTNEIQTYFGIIIMPATVTSLIAQFIVYPFITSIDSYFKNKEFHALSRLVNRIVLAIVGIGIVIVIIAAILGIPMLEFIYNVNLSSYHWLLIVIMIGSILNACIYVFSNVLISLRELKLQTLVYFIVAILSLLVSRLLVSHYSIDGASYAYLISMFLLFLPYYLINKYTIKKLEAKS